MDFRCPVIHGLALVFTVLTAAGAQPSAPPGTAALGGGRQRGPGSRRHPQVGSAVRPTSFLWARIPNLGGKAWQRGP